MNQWWIRGAMLVLGSAAAVLASCGGGEDAPAADDAPGSSASKLDPKHPALAIAAAGHGWVFDRKHERLQLDAGAIAELQAVIRKEAERGIEKLDPEVAQLVEEADRMREDKQFSDAERQLLQGGVAWRLLVEGSKETRDALEWRLEVLNEKIFVPAGKDGKQQKPREGDPAYVLHPKIRDLLFKLRYLDIEWRFPWFLKSYVEQCRDAGVPVPPDWAQSGTAWVNQGTLSHNILDPGGFARVWTYTDPANRGACVALPRGSGATGSAAGIICQSASTGKACFWDNKLRTVAPEAFMGWDGLTLRIADLKDGSNLAAACTACHRGNNVYLMSPDDATWAKLMRGPLALAGQFTTRVEASSDNAGGHPRYVPYTGWFARTEWVNTFDASPSCSGGCHEKPSGFANTPPMPPACAGTLAGCYAP